MFFQDCFREVAIKGIKLSFKSNLMHKFFSMFAGKDKWDLYWVVCQWLIQ